MPIIAGYMPTLVKAEEGEKEEQLYKLDPYFGFVPAEKSEEDMPETEARKKREAESQFLYPGTVAYVPGSVHQLVYQPIYQPVNYVPAQSAQTVQTFQKVATTDEEKPAEETKPVVVQNPVLLPGVINPILQPVVINPVQVTQVAASPLPENEFPVFPNDPETNEQGALEF